MSVTLPSNSTYPAQVGNSAPAAESVVPKNDRASEAPRIPGTSVPVGGALGASDTQELLAARSSQQAIQSLFPAGGQLPVAPPPPGLPNDPANHSLGSKCRALLAADADGAPAESANLGDSAAGPAETDPAPGNGTVGGTNEPARRPVPTTNQFSMTALLNTFLKVTMEQFKSSMVEAQQDLQLKVSDLDAAAQDVVNAAKKRFGGAVAMGAGSMAMGAMGMMAAGVNLKGTFNANKALANSGIPAGQQGMEFQRLTAPMSGWATGVQNSGSILQGGMQVLQGQEDSAAAVDDSDKTKDEKASVTDEALYSNAQNMRQQMTATLQDTLEKVKSWEQSQDQAATTIIHNI
jgi:hypothetical protein